MGVRSARFEHAAMNVMRTMNFSLNSTYSMLILNTISFRWDLYVEASLYCR